MREKERECVEEVRESERESVWVRERERERVREMFNIFTYLRKEIIDNTLYNKRKTSQLNVK